MYLVFALLIVAVIAVGTIVALRHPTAGATGGAIPDGPTTAIGSVGNLGADDLRRVRFPIAFRGYRPAEVDALLDALAAQLDNAPQSLGVPIATATPGPNTTPGPNVAAPGPEGSASSAILATPATPATPASPDTSENPDPT